jgi:Kef-type K+ transport system membrane component KefB
MFIVGIDLDAAHLRRMAHAAVWVSHLSITVPFLLGTALSLMLYRSLAAPGTSFTAFALFMGIAMSITAFPVLARILAERGLTQTPLGATAIACAAVDDVSAWCLLALVVTLAKATALSGALFTFLLTVAFVALMLLVVKPLAARLLRGEVESEALVAGALAFVFLCALATEVIGIHALFGAFLAGWRCPATAACAPTCGGGWRPSPRRCCCRCSSPSPACARRWGCWSAGTTGWSARR